jgi:hypothetical protein
MILHGDCLHHLRAMPDASVDSIVTDPPYGLAFMGKRWDYDVPSVEIWAECLRVLKPGGHLLAFAGTRTQHRMAVRIEDAGFEIRDMIAWLYGSGFPKSLDVSKAIDKAAGAKGTVVATGLPVKRMIPGAGQNATGSWIKDSGREYQPGEYRPATDAARQWSGWGTALKPALEPITVARKPLVGTVAQNVLTHGTGALNIDGCRIPTDDTLGGGMFSKGRPRVSDGWDRPWMHDPEVTGRKKVEAAAKVARAEALGRWPANLIHDGSDEVTALFPQSKGQQGAVGPQHGAKASVNTYGNYGPRDDFQPRGDTGSAARFFYTAKASQDDRDDGLDHMPSVRTAAMQGNMTDGQRLAGDGKPIAKPTRANHHPTVKPTDLMRYLCRLVTPPGGLVLDPFCGSGSTGKAAVQEGFRFIGIERESDYAEIARARIAGAHGPLFARLPDAG